MALSTRETLRALPRPMWALVAGAFINRFGAFVYIFLALYVTGRGYSASQAGIAIGAYSVGAIGATLLGGRLADQLGRRATIALSMCASAVGMLALSQAQRLPEIMLLTGATGMAAELYQPAASALVADLVPQGQRVTGFALYRLAINAGSATGPAVAGFLAGRSYFPLFLGDALTSLAFAAIALLALPNRVIPDSLNSLGGSPQSAPAPVPAGPPGGKFYGREFLIFLGATILIGFGYTQLDITLGLQVRALGQPVMLYGALLSLNGLLVIACELPLTGYTRHLAPRVVLSAGALLIAAGVGLVAFAASPGALALCVLIWTAGEMIHFPVAGAYVADLAPPEARGRYAGARGFAWNAGMILAAVVGTLLFTWNARQFWLLCGAIVAVAAAIIYVTQRPTMPAR
jgi:MFS family permease